MSDKLDILIIAPDAPPKNSPESMQVRRMLLGLDSRATGVLVTTPTLGMGGWVRSDPSLELDLEQIETMILKLPAHSLVSRVLTSQRMVSLMIPDSQVWLSLMGRHLCGRLSRIPDVIYSRSDPMSAALLGMFLKKRLAKPWIMHMSDPWVESPYWKRTSWAAKRDASLEAACFASADLICMTSEGQARHYREKYPHRSSCILVSPNVMPVSEPLGDTFSDSRDDVLSVVYAGALYGNRSPDTLLAAITLLRSRFPEYPERLRFDFYGNAQEEARRILSRASEVVYYHGLVNFAAARAAQRAADILLVIEPDGGHPLLKHFLPSKVMDYLSLGKPMLAITPRGSETWRLCEEGHGWAIEPSDAEGLAALLSDLAKCVDSVRLAPRVPPPVRYSVDTVVDELIQRMEVLVNGTAPRGAK